MSQPPRDRRGQERQRRGRHPGRRRARSHHGYEIAKLIEQRTDGNLRFTLASLYATLYRLEDRGWIKGRWVEKAGQRRRCYYRITEAGRKVLAEQREDWRRFVAALARWPACRYALSQWKARGTRMS